MAVEAYVTVILTLLPTDSSQPLDLLFSASISGGQAGTILPSPFSNQCLALMEFLGHFLLPSCNEIKSSTGQASWAKRSDLNLKFTI